MWFKIRILLIASGFLSGIFTPTEQADALHSLPGWMLAIVFIVFSVAAPLMVLFVIAIQSINPMSDKIWTQPNHRVNPFQPRNPLLFFHFAAYYAGACGLGALVASLWRDPNFAIYGLLVLLVSSMVLLGVHLSARVFKNKLATPAPSPTP